MVRKQWLSNKSTEKNGKITGYNMVQKLVRTKINDQEWEN